MATLDHVSSAVKAAWLQPEVREDSFRSCLGEIAASGIILDICRQASEDARFAQALAARSFYHPTGVSKLILTESSHDEPELRVHFWPPIGDAKGNELSIHDHRWDFASLVLAGELNHEIFALDPAGTPFHAVEFRKVADQKVYDVHKVGIRKLTCSAQKSARPGESYFLASSTLHRMTNQTAQAAVTLFLRSPYLSDRTLVCHEDENAIVAGTYPQRMNVSTAARLLRLLAGGLAGDGSAFEANAGTYRRECDRALQGDRRKRAPLQRA